MSGKTGVPMAWDPKNPAALLVPTGGSGGATPFGEETVAAMQINTILSHTGVGSNEHEIVALMQLLDAHESQSQQKPATRTSWNTIKTLSKAYRSALRECLSRWEDNLADLQEAMTDGNEQDLSVENLELLKTVYAVTQLSEIFLLPPPAEEIAMEYYNDAFHVPGALTADTVRYLRHHHTTNSMQQLDPDVAEELAHSLHPDQVDGGAPYWNLVNSLVRKGNLEQAWAWLSRHSAARRSFDAISQPDTMSNLDDYEAQTLEQDKEGFEDLRRILLSAPIPGGREEDFDAGLDGPALQPPQEEILLEGVEPSAYQLWETSRTTTEGNDFPINYNPRTAAMKRQNWQQYIPELGSLKRLKRRIPQLDGILTILSGNIKAIRFDSWAEALIAELIYQNPMMMPSNIQVRAEKLMAKYPRTLYAEMDDVLLRIMQGNAGQVIDLMQSFGGGSGAALPATMTSLLCNLYVDANIMLPCPLQTELLKSAAFAITSSLGAKHSDTAAQLVVRLLLPFAKARGDASIVATLGQTLEHHTPGSDLEANNLISLCRRLVEKKSVVVLEGCVSLALSRHRKYLKENRPGGAVHWLLVGMELEALVYAVEKDGDIHKWEKVSSTSVCYRHLVSWCNRMSGTLLVGIMETKEGLGYVIETVKEMLDSVKEGPMEGYATRLPEVRTLELVLGIYDGMADANKWSEAASCITMCLQEEPNDYDDGVVACTAPRSMHWSLVQLAHRIVQEDEKRQGSTRVGEYTPSFDVKGIQVLLEQLAQIPLCREIEGAPALPADIVKKMQLSFGKALARAFVAENARRKPKDLEEPDDVAISRIRSVDLHNHNIRTQERVVKMMLDI